MTDQNPRGEQPSTPEEAEVHERPMRRQLLLGLLVGAAVIIVLIVTVMEVRYRAALAEPDTSAALDQALESVLDPLTPLPDALQTVEVNTTREGDAASYQVFLRDGQGRLLYHLGRRADSLYTLDAGRRAGDAVNLQARLQVEPDRGDVTGSYQPDRGVPVSHYQALLGNVVREAVVGYQVQMIHPLDVDPLDARDLEPSRLRRQWEAVMD